MTKNKKELVFKRHPQALSSSIEACMEVEERLANQFQDLHKLFVFSVETIQALVSQIQFLHHKVPFNKYAHICRTRGLRWRVNL